MSRDFKQLQIDWHWNEYSNSRTKKRSYQKKNQEILFPFSSCLLPFNSTAKEWCGIETVESWHSWSNPTLIQTAASLVSHSPQSILIILFVSCVNFSINSGYYFFASRWEVMRTAEWNWNWPRIADNWKCLYYYWDFSCLLSYSTVDCKNDSILFQGKVIFIRGNFRVNFTW